MNKISEELPKLGSCFMADISDVRVIPHFMDIDILYRNKLLNKMSEEPLF